MVDNFKIFRKISQKFQNINSILYKQDEIKLIIIKIINFILLTNGCRMISGINSFTL